MKKVGLWLEAFSKHCAREYSARRDLSLDEQTIGHKGRWTTLTHQNRNKPAGQGFKIYSINEVETGYTMCFKLDRKDGTTIHDTVMSLVEEIDGEGHHIYMDNLFVKPPTLDAIKAAGQRACGTWRNNFGVPAELVNPDSLKNPGDFEWRCTDNNMTGYAWLDSGVCHLLSNIHDPMEVGTVRRRQKGVRGRQSRKAPMAAVFYNINMIATDKCDQMRRTFTTQRW